MTIFRQLLHLLAFFSTLPDPGPLNSEPEPNTPMFQTLRTNLRILFAFLAIAIAFSVAADVVTRLSAIDGAPPGLSNVVAMLTGFSNFVGAHACAWLIGLPFGWPTLNRYGNPVERWKDGLTPGMQASARESFDTGWAGVTPRARFYVFVAVAIGELIAAAICFGK